jgi:hypothetical protein
MQVIGIAGTAKNTGKTTTLTALLAEAARQGVIVGLTSIGYDGEWRDNITGLPKPRITCRQGNFVAVAEKCLNTGTSRVQVLERTGIPTPLGEVVIGLVAEPGLMTIAGPNKSHELRAVIDRLRTLGCALLLVDGALNRITPMVETDGIILATGAARHLEMDLLAAETGTLSRLLNRRNQPSKALAAAGRKQVSLEEKGRLVRVIGSGSLLSEAQMSEVATVVTERTNSIFIPGAVTTGVLAQLVQRLGSRLKGKNLVFPSAINLVIGGEPQAMLPVLEEVQRLGGRVQTLRKVPLLAVTVNPYYPAFRFESNRYTGATVDADELLEKVSQAVSVPVIDVKKDGGKRLLEIILRQQLHSSASNQEASKTQP